MTVIDEVAVLPPSWVVTVIVAVPAATAVTKPLAFTLAIPLLLLLQLTFLFVALEGATVAVSCCVPPTLSVAEVGLTLTPVTGTLEVFTVTEHVAVLP